MHNAVAVRTNYFKSRIHKIVPTVVAFVIWYWGWRILSTAFSSVQ